MPHEYFSRFPAQHRTQLEACAARSVRLAQLAVSHPLAFFAIATEYGPEALRAEALDLVEQGSPLHRVSNALDIPHALRSLEPEALLRPLTHARISKRAGPILAGRLRQIPSLSKRALALEAAFWGTRLCDEEFGLWLTGPRVVDHLPASVSNLRGLALHAWVSKYGTNLPSCQRTTVWSSKMSWATSVRQAMRWLDFLKFDIYFGATPIQDCWGRPGMIDGFEIVPLSTAESLIEEARYMGNCLHSYADCVFAGQCRLFSVRTRGEKLGTLEVRWTGSGKLRLGQFLGPGNSSMTLAAWHAVHAWWSEQDRDENAHAVTLPAVGERLQILLRQHTQARQLSDDFWSGLQGANRLARELHVFALAPRHFALEGLAPAHRLGQH